MSEPRGFRHRERVVIEAYADCLLRLHEALREFRGATRGFTPGWALLKEQEIVAAVRATVRCARLLTVRED